MPASPFSTWCQSFCWHPGFIVRREPSVRYICLTRFPVPSISVSQNWIWRSDPTDTLQIGCIGSNIYSLSWCLDSKSLGLLYLVIKHESSFRPRLSFSFIISLKISDEFVISLDFRDLRPKLYVQLLVDNQTYLELFTLKISLRSVLTSLRFWEEIYSNSKSTRSSKDSICTFLSSTGFFCAVINSGVISIPGDISSGLASTSWSWTIGTNSSSDEFESLPISLLRISLSFSIVCKSPLHVHVIMFNSMQQ